VQRPREDFRRQVKEKTVGTTHEKKKNALVEKGNKRGEAEKETVPKEGGNAGVSDCQKRGKRKLHVT